jgi:hypothetical protein
MPTSKLFVHSAINYLPTLSIHITCYSEAENMDYRVAPFPQLKLRLKLSSLHCYLFLLFFLQLIIPIYMHGGQMYTQLSRSHKRRSHCQQITSFHP